MKKIIGINPVRELLIKRTKLNHIEIYNGLNENTKNELIELAKKNNTKIKKINKRYENSQGVIAYIEDYDYYIDFLELIEKMAKKDKSIILLLDGVQDPRNLGAIIRSAEIFGVDAIILPQKGAVKINETVVKTSTGAIEYVPISVVNNLSEAIDNLKKIDYIVYGADGKGETFYHEESYKGKIALVLGSEGFGMRFKTQKKCDKLIKIPMKGKINSLNVSVATGILLSEISKNI
ncbi:23S rRNA (guanosine2251-2'-O)-methyltransferase [Hypnocyclicus thermotrophus]|uniref:23S rRNA (Guanosine2251-2'-O)-methyltransferase n=1 Tax=Hypnocyclicus thermotrophus TaxID=1627895 RepID=A0AA46I4X9_9FUSO|nr:23S rRNA (guanosine(2251)-2'-O)-methyltransferase RlmB [Hypnocyclicus thermotrophus]TDT67907.1 23S rRNA (guanosine2251-2'-O)-methyltransferase [Hypnocyclicus thermotrophus]